MTTKSVSTFVSISIFFVTLGYCISKYIEYKYYVPISSKIFFESKPSANISKSYDVEDILKINPFKLYVSLDKPVNKMQEDTQENKSEVAVSDKIDVLGYTYEKGLVLALVNLNGKPYVFSSEKDVNGYIIKYVENDILVLDKDGKEIKLKLKESGGSTDKTSLPPLKKDTKADSSLNYKISRSEIEDQIKDINALIRTVFISPYYDKGDFVGYRISRMAKDSILRKIGINSGDVIVRINGDSVDSPQKAMELLGKMSDVTAVSIDILRNGQKKSLFVEIN